MPMKEEDVGLEDPDPSPDSDVWSAYRERELPYPLPFSEDRCHIPSLTRLKPTHQVAPAIWPKPTGLVLES